MKFSTFSNPTVSTDMPTQLLYYGLLLQATQLPAATTPLLRNLLPPELLLLICVIVGATIRATREEPAHALAALRDAVSATVLVFLGLLAVSEKYQIALTYPACFVACVAGALGNIAVEWLLGGQAKAMLLGMLTRWAERLTDKKPPTQN